jgi:hypothetical protein
MAHGPSDNLLHHGARTGHDGGLAGGQLTGRYGASALADGSQERRGQRCGPHRGQEGGSGGTDVGCR